MHARGLITALIFLWFVAPGGSANADTNYTLALRRAQYFLTGTMPDTTEIADAGSEGGYQASVRTMMDHPGFYDAVLRYHQRLLGVGLQLEYVSELLRADIDNKSNKVARLSCLREDGIFRCLWLSRFEKKQGGDCSRAQEQSVSVFWFPGVSAWVCPSVARICGPDLSSCFIEFSDKDEARYSELGTTEAFDSRFAVMRSLSLQPAGLATAVALANYPYTKILEPGLTAVDGAIAHFYRQENHFDLDRLNLPTTLLSTIKDMPLTDSRFRLVNLGSTYEQAGILSSFGWLRRYEKNRSRANQLYERLLCRQFTSQLPRVFPADPGNLATTPGCSGCHAVLDPLSAFFATWGEGGELYAGTQAAVSSSFGGKTGTYLSDLADIVRNDNAFATCQVQHVWEWLVGRKFHRDEADLRAVLTAYFISTSYSFRELVYAVATHPVFMSGSRSDATVAEPLDQPPLGEPPGGATLPPCPGNIDYATTIAPKISRCTNCHVAGSSRQALESEADWSRIGATAVSLMTSGAMPPEAAGSPPLVGPIYDLKEAVRCWLEQ